ncbi:MAG: PQQ-binding-like beta-propeller repeat protein [Pseudomonadales bacterium]|nr:PQQ-binding-like beta-propeller repeat protein [Pseudomonadales bacterium]
MPFSSLVLRMLVMILALAVCSDHLLAKASTREGVYTAEQAQAGATLYVNSCIECHGATLRGSEAGPALTGAAFWDKWEGQALGVLYQLTASTMPVNDPDGFSAEEYAAVVAFMLQQNGLPAGSTALVASAAALTPITLQASAEPVRVASVASGTSSSQRRVDAEWLSYHGTEASLRYTPLGQIDRNNVERLDVAWRWFSANHGPQPEFNYQATPLMVDGVLYTTAGRRRDVVAIDPVTGETLWMYRLDEGARRGPRVNSGRGLALWRNEEATRLILITPGYQMLAIDPETQRPDPTFGVNGIVDLRLELEERFEIDPASIAVGSTSPAMIVGDVIVVGAAFPSGAAPASPQEAAGNIRGYDVHTGTLLWKFHTIPQGDEFGVETWHNNSNAFTGSAGAWSTLSADIEQGIVYVPVEAATGDVYGGHRPGDNLFSQSLVALDARTGERVWHYQMVHHDVWDYDPPTGPILADLVVEGREIPAAIQVTKMGFVFTFNRLTGEPVWPIEERAVPQGSVPGERLSATQPFPTRPAPFEMQGISADNLIDFTPELRRNALALLKNYTWGPLYTAPSLVDENNRGTLFMPGVGGGANWQGAAFDPETNIIYIPSTSLPMGIGLVKNPPNTAFDYAMAPDSFVVHGPDGLPLIKPPYGRITAIDMNRGEHLWMMANAATPEEIRTHPRLRGVEIPERTGHGERGALLVTKSLLFAGEGAALYGGQTGGGRMFRAHDKLTGEILAELELPAKQTGLPMSYAIDGIQYIVVPIGDTGHPGELVALRVRR